MRLRKKTWSFDVFEEYKEYWSSPNDTNKGKWKELLDTDTLRVEIGSGKGNYWHALGELYPNDGIVAIEKDYTASSIALKKIEHYGIHRKRFIYGNAKALTEIFAKGEVDIIHLNFSDPWPKERHEKRRLTYKDKLKDYFEVLSEEGYLILKTDNVGFFNYSVVSIGQANFVLEELNVDFRRQEQEDPFTEYERKFHEMGQPIFRGVWRKK